MSTQRPARPAPKPPKPRKHLMTPGQPPRPVRSGMTLTSVQRWIMSTLAVTTILHLSGGLVVAARFIEPRSSKVGLLVIAAAFGLVAFAAGLLIHGKSPLHPLVLLGLLPALLGAWWVLG
jgi:membrane associated rhomboid family serine protease